MKKHFLLLSYFIILGVLISSCKSGLQDEVSPVSSQVQAIYNQNAAISKTLIGNWNTDMVKSNGILIYSKANQAQNSIDYGKFQIELKSDSKFSMQDKNGNQIEGDWYVTNGNTLNLDYMKSELTSCCIAATAEIPLHDKVIVTIAFSLLKSPTANLLEINNSNIDFVMKPTNID